MKRQGQASSSSGLGRIAPLPDSNPARGRPLCNRKKMMGRNVNPGLTEPIFNASTCGDNCAKWILDMAKDRKLVVNLYHVMDFGREDFKIKVVNSGRIVHNMAELIHESIPYL